METASVSKYHPLTASAIQYKILNYFVDIWYRKSNKYNGLQPLIYNNIGTLINILGRSFGMSEELPVIEIMFLFSSVCVGGVKPIDEESECTIFEKSILDFKVITYPAISFVIFIAICSGLSLDKTWNWNSWVFFMAENNVL